MDIAVMLKEIQVAPGFFLEIMRLTQLTTFGASVLRTTLRLNSTLSYSKLHKWQGEDIIQHIVLKG